MRHSTPRLRMAAAFALAAVFLPSHAGEPGPLPSAAEATARARLLHAAIDGALRIMHRDFFRKGDSKAIPSESLQDVFKSIADEHGVTLRWVATEETAQNDEHKAADDFQKSSLAAFAKGEKEATKEEKGRLRHLGVITLQNQCLKCHVPDRKTLEERFSGLEISMPVAGSAAK